MNRKTSKNKDANIQKAKVRTPVEKLRGKETIEHYNAVLLEDIRSKMEQVIEGMEATKDELKKEARHLEQHLTQEIELLKSVVHKHSGTLGIPDDSYVLVGNRIKESNLQIVELRTEIKDMNEGLATKLVDVKNDMNAMETRLSNKMDAIGTRIDDHEAKPVNIAHKAA